LVALDVAVVGRKIDPHVDHVIRCERRFGCKATKKGLWRDILRLAAEP
jgi:hypothetical protein